MTPKNYIYRYDKWSSHINMHNDMLRARIWSNKEYESWPHKPLIATEENLKEGEGIFRICFWKNFMAAAKEISFALCSELYVLQRVRDDHPFFENFHKIDDDFLPNTAWLYWQKRKYKPTQQWSSAGIPKQDFEVLDLDGQWRVCSESTIMASPHVRLTRQGWQPHYFLVNNYSPQVVYWTSRLIRPESEEPFIGLLLQNPQEERGAPILLETHAMQMLVNNFVKYSASAMPVSKLRLFILQESPHRFDTSHLFEIPMVWHHSETSGSRSRFQRLLNLSSTRYERVLEIKKHSQLIYDDSSNVWDTIISAFEMIPRKREIANYQTILEGMRLSAQQEGKSAKPSNHNALANA